MTEVNSEANSSSSLEALVQQGNYIKLAKELDIPVIEVLDPSSFSKDWYEHLPYSFVNRHLVLPIGEEDGIYTIAVVDPLKLDVLGELELLLKKPLKMVCVPKTELVDAIRYCYDRDKQATSEFIQGLSDKKRADEGSISNEFIDLLDDQGTQAPIIRLINLILTEAIQQGASDIHFEPLENDLRVRYRIDGVLQNRHSPSPEYSTHIITRLKVMAGMDIAEHRLPQDGRIKIQMGGKDIDFRVSTVPIVHGERVVLRILDKGNVVLGLDNIGMTESVLRHVRKSISCSEGLVLVTGPTGSGKTTTLYSALSELSSDECNIMTIEDPVEYKLPGIAQIGVRSKISLDFAKGLRHILRQDPDVIMVGEIRDVETAEIALQASLTGHLVLSTLHTNDASGAITRLVDMGVANYLLASCLVGVLAQRLVRKVCPNCKEVSNTSREELESLGLSADSVLYRGRGCEECFETGYKGRCALYEFLPVDHEIRKAILASSDSILLRDLAVEKGMRLLASCGRDLVLEGQTTISEVLRVTRGIED